MLLSQQSKAQTTVDPITGQVSIVIDPATGATLTVTQNQPLEEIKNNPAAINVSPQLGDDGSTTVQLPFTFEYYGQKFDSVKMMSNGVLSFPGKGGSYCCDGADISELTNKDNNYIIAAAWADLVTLNNSAYYLSTPDSVTFGWYGVIEYYNHDNRNSFEVELYSLGDVDLRYGGLDITNHEVSAGLTGDLSKGEYIDLYYGQGFSLDTPLVPDVSGPDPCELNPLFSPSCSGYEQAYYTQQCTANPLYDTGCPGYAQAYYTQQCGISPLYDSGCPGYAEAYFYQQCQLDPLYDTNCNGYAEAYYNQQCSIDPLYDSGCPGYTEAVFRQNCATDPLFDSRCDGYATAVALKLSQEQQTALLNESLSNPEPLDTLLSTQSEPVQLTSMQDEIVQTIPVEEVTSTIVEEPTAEDKAAAEEMMKEVVGESTDKKPTDKQKAAVAAKIAELKKELESGKASAKEIAAIQAQLVMLVSFVPGFDQYYITIPDAPFYQQEQVYQNQQVPSNRNAARFGLASELRYDEMVQMQYNRSK